jgi:hypothetical protein
MPSQMSFGLGLLNDLRYRRATIGRCLNDGYDQFRVTAFAGCSRRLHVSADRMSAVPGLIGSINLIWFCTVVCLCDTSRPRFRLDAGVPSEWPVTSGAFFSGTK